MVGGDGRMVLEKDGIVDVVFVVVGFERVEDRCRGEWVVMMFESGV